MLSRVSKSALFTVAALLVGIASLRAADKPTTGPTLNPKVFQVLDNLHYKGRPDTGPLGMVHCNIVYLDQGTKKKGYDAVPDEKTFKEKVRKQSVVPGPIVLDLESLNLTGAAADKNIKIFVTLVKWAHEAAPGSVVGYYGHGLFPNPPDKEHAKEALKLAQAVDAFFPSMYTFNDKREEWKKKLEGLVKEAHEIAPGKPVYPYLWPQYHEGTPKALKYVDGDYWTFQLETARACHVNGIVLWSGGNAFKDDAWWPATLKFMSGL